MPSASYRRRISVVPSVEPLSVTMKWSTPCARCQLRFSSRTSASSRTFIAMTSLIARSNVEAGGLPAGAERLTVGRHGGEQAQPVVGAGQRVDGVFGMRHQADDVAGVVAHARDVAGGAGGGLAPAVAGN